MENIEKLKASALKHTQRRIALLQVDNSLLHATHE